jgi:hypothetical protein
MHLLDAGFFESEIPFDIPEASLAAKPEAVFLGCLSCPERLIADEIPNPPLSFFVTSSAHTDLKSVRGVLAIINPSKTAMALIAVKLDLIELDPFSLIVNLGRSIDPNDEVDPQFVEQHKERMFRKSTVGCQSNS